MVALPRPGELRAIQTRLDRFEALLQLVEVGNDQPYVPTQDLGAPSRQVELRLADVDMHVIDADRVVGIAREAEADEVEQRGLQLVRHRDVQVLHHQDAANVESRDLFDCRCHRFPPTRLMAPFYSQPALFVTMPAGPRSSC